MEFLFFACGVAFGGAVQHLIHEILKRRGNRNRFVRSARHAPPVPTRNRVRTTRSSTGEKVRISKPSVRGKYRSRL